MSQPVPGWYPDPAGTPRLRWWNGGMWIDRSQPMPGATQQQPPSPQGMPHALAGQAIPSPQATGGLAQQSSQIRSGSPANNASHMPDSRPAPAVSSDPYHASSKAPSFGLPNDAEFDDGPTASTASSGKRWHVGAGVAWVLAVVLLGATLFTGARFMEATKDLREAKSDHATAQQELDQAQRGRDEAQNELQEEQK